MRIVAVLAGLSVIALVLVPNGGLTTARKLGFAALGVLFAVYGVVFAGQGAGSPKLFVLTLTIPVLVGWEIWREIREHRRRAEQWQPPVAPLATVTASSVHAGSAASGSTAPFQAGTAVPPAAAEEPCVACGAQLRAGVRFCTRCGTPVPSPVAAEVSGPSAVHARPPASEPSRLSASPWTLRIAFGVAGIVVLVVVSVIARNVLDRGPSTGEQADVGGALMAAAMESMCVNPAIEGQYFAEEIAGIIDEDTWADSPAYPAVVEAPFVQLALTCGYDYGLAALDSIGVVGVTYGAIDGAMMAAVPPLVAEPAPEPEDDGASEPAPEDDGPLVVPGVVTLWGGGAIGDLGHFAPEDSAITTLANELGAPESVDDVSCSDGVINGRQYRWGDFAVLVEEEGFTYEHPAGGTVTVEAPYVGGWMLTPGDGARTGLRTAEGLGKDDSVADLLAAYPDAYVVGPGADGTVDWEYFGGDMSSYVFTTTGEAPDDFVVSIRSGTVCHE